VLIVGGVGGKDSKIFKMVNKLRAGVVWANTGNKFDPTNPLGGYKNGFGHGEVS
jgi:aldehyde dehydrogenase (NAD+)